MTSFHYHARYIAHRGASAYAPENTFAAFIKALQMQAKWIEFDVMLTADKELVVFHDEMLNRTTNAHGALHQFPYAYLQTVDAGSWFHPHFSGEMIPLFASVMQFVKEQHLSVNIELKPRLGEEKKIAQLLLKVLENLQIQLDAKILVSSFSFAALQALHGLNKTINLAYLMDDYHANWREHAEEINCAAIHMNEVCINKTIAKEIKSLGYALSCYTVNDVKRAETLFHWGVDAIFTDYPDLQTLLSYQ